MASEILNLQSWMNQKNARGVNVNLRKGVDVRPVSIAITGSTDEYIIVQESGILDSVDFSGMDAIPASDSAYLTFSITNLGQLGSGTVEMLSPNDSNTTKLTGGTGLVADGKKSLTVHGTRINRNVTEGDRLRIRAAATGSLPNVVRFPTYMIRFRGQAS